MRKVLVASMLYFFTTSAFSNTPAEWDNWRADFGNGGVCNLWNTYIDQNQSPISFVNLSFVRFFDLGALRAEKLDLPLRSLVLMVSVPVTSELSGKFDEVRSVSINEYKLNSLVEEQAEVMRWHFIGEPESQAMLDALRQKEEFSLMLETKNRVRYSVRHSEREHLSFQIRNAQFDACVEVMYSAR